jgi:hypothetical protein
VNGRYYHELVSSRPSCPVCKKAVYSRGGIHPQCAMIQSEPPRPKPPKPQGPDGAVMPASGEVLEPAAP